MSCHCALLQAANSMVVPMLKMSYALEHGLPVTAGTPFVALMDYAGMVICPAYTVAVLL